LGFTSDSKWIVIGGSYAGNLAAWIRLKYPDIVYAAHSSSAPVHVVVDYWRYGYATDLGLSRLSSQKCTDGFVNAIQVLDNLIKFKGDQYVLSLFGAHETLDIRDLASAVSSIFAESVQYGIQYCKVQINGIFSTCVEAMCNGINFPEFIDTNITDSKLITSLGTFLII
jgi:serine protease 16